MGVLRLPGDWRPRLPEMAKQVLEGRKSILNAGGYLSLPTSLPGRARGPGTATQLRNPCSHLALLLGQVETGSECLDRVAKMSFD